MPAQVPDNSNAKTVLQIMNAEPRSAVPNNNSQQHLMNDETATRSPPITCKQQITVVILCFVNLINYMDRYTIAGNIPILDFIFSCMHFPLPVSSYAVQLPQTRIICESNNCLWTPDQTPMTHPKSNGFKSLDVQFTYYTIQN